MLCADELLIRPSVTVSGARPAAERAWLMSASTGSAGGPCWDAGGAPAEPDGEADEVPGRGEAGDAVGSPERLAAGVCGTRAMLTLMGPSAQAPAGPEPQVSGVGEAAAAPVAAAPVVAAAALDGEAAGRPCT